MGTDINTIAQIYKQKRWQTKLVEVAGDFKCMDSFAYLGCGNPMFIKGETLCNQRGLPEDLFYEHHPIAPDHIIVKIGNIMPYGSYFTYEEDYYGEINEYDRRQKIWPETTFDIGFHDHGWITLEELHDFIKKTKFNSLLDIKYIWEAYRELIEIAKREKVAFKNVRLIFGFDS